MADVQGFIQQFGPVAAAVSQRIGVAPDVLLGQWGLETGWGKSVVPGTNNLGNIKGLGVAAKDNQTGSVDQYRAYSSPLDFGNDFVNLIANNYKNAIGKGSDAAGYAGALKAGGYAEDPKYVGKLSSAVDMVRKFGDTIASALSGMANASELTPAQMGSAPVISATGQRLNGPQAVTAPEQSVPAPAASAGDPLLDMAQGVMGGTSKPASQASAAGAPSASQPAQQSDDPLMAMAAGVMAAKDQPAKATQAPAAPSKAPAPTAPATPTNLLGAAVEPLLTAATGAIATPAGWATRLGAALTGSSFDQAKQAGESIQNALTYHPVTAGGQQANADIGRVAGNALSAIANTAPVKALTDAYQRNFVQGQSPIMATVNDMVPGVTAAAIAPELAGRATNLVKAIGRPDVPTPMPGSIELANRGVGPVPQGLPVAQMDRLPVAQSSNDLAFIQRPGDIRVGQPMEAAPAQGLTAAPVANDAVGLNRIASNDATGARPNLPQAPTPQPVARGTPANDAAAAAPIPTPAPAALAEVPRFDAEAPSTVKSSLAPAQQQQNLDLMREIGLDSTRPSAISGDKFSAGQEYQLAKTDTPQGEVLRAQFDRERTALQNYAQQISQDTGARGASPEEVGQIIRQPLRDLNAYYDNAVSGIYQAADQRAAGIAGIDADAFKTLMDTRSNFAGKAENGSLGRGINAYLREQGLRNADGTFNPMTAEQAEGVRQYINSQWSPQNSGLIGKIKESLDTDVAKSAGDDVYAQARALHAERKNLLDNPNGISSLLNEQGPNGINQAIPDEKVGQKLMSMPVGQLRHIVDTLNNAPAELQPVAQQALSEMRGVFADGVRNAGQGAEWNAAKVTRMLNDQRSRMGMLFDDAQMGQFRTLNDAGHVLQKPTAYPGAAAQGHNLLQRAVIWAPTAATTGAASALFGPLGAAVAAPAGAALTRKATQFVNERAANKLLESFSKPQIDWQQ
ncbi:flagellar rod assembly protein/muramidase FlgJ [Burkholderia aenigmatica]|uniref:glucosaminidase domain-containing protein n=1 Tax=Burkholderia aenigmatica TaxID=2015348 RepID=UPI001452D607|nr:glucosaminidase domain-containing protein [Burkholderia aenigmatica]VWD60992.1 flagellar rod assembly protein/muramidase FlgJ [Burkholderia aenigmatica]